MAAAILAFPARGGSGFKSNQHVVRHADYSQVADFSCYRANRIYAEHRPAEPDFTFERTPEMLICMALYKALPSDLRAKALQTVSATYAAIGDEESRIASRLLAALSLTADEDNRGRK